MEILLVEDDDSIASVIDENVGKWGHTIKHAKTGREALKKVTKKRFDLILLDIFLPDCMGHRLIQHFKILWPTAGIVTMTGYNSWELELEVRQQGIFYYLIKPFMMVELKEVIDHISNLTKRRRKDNE